MWSDAARAAAIAARKGGDAAEPVASAPVAATHQDATNAVPRDMAASAAADAAAKMASAGHGSVDRSPPTNYSAPRYVTPASAPANVARSYDQSKVGDKTDSRRSYDAPSSAPTRAIADYSDKTADQGRSAGVIDRLSATYGR